MWQDHTPAETSGLARLGFTALRLIGSGGRIDPVRLAALRASGLPYYIENIATDVLAPFHRYTPGKAVTWLFDAAKDRLRAEPADTSVFQREPGLSDPASLASIERRLERMVRAHAQDRPLFYNLADEAGIGDLAAAWDADIGPSSLAAMRVWLRTQYPDLAALNRQWGTDFPNWDAVMPELTDAALRRTDDNFSAWADFKAWMDIAFAQAVRTGTDAVHRADRLGLAGLEGAQIPGWGGYDYSRLAGTVDVMEIGGAGNSVELAHAFNPNLILLRTSFGRGPEDAHAAWWHLLHGGRGTVVWDSSNTVVQPDGGARPWGRELTALTAAMRPVARWLRRAEPITDPVAVLYSQASFRTRWLLDRRGGDRRWWQRDAAREYEDNAWTASRRQILTRLASIAVQPRLLSSAMLESGALRHNAPRVLILPHAIALSAAEVAEIAAFAQSGGLVLADIEPGLFDQHSRRRASPPLDGIARTPEILQLYAGENGSGLLLATKELLISAGIQPRADLIGAKGAVMTGVDGQWFQDEQGLVLALQTRTAGTRAEPIIVRRPHHPDHVITLDPIAPRMVRFER